MDRGDRPDDLLLFGALAPVAADAGASAGGPCPRPRPSSARSTRMPGCGRPPGVARRPVTAGHLHVQMHHVGTGARHADGGLGVVGGARRGRGPAQGSNSDASPSRTTGWSSAMSRRIGVSVTGCSSRPGLRRGAGRGRSVPPSGGQLTLAVAAELLRPPPRSNSSPTPATTSFTDAAPVVADPRRPACGRRPPARRWRGWRLRA